MRTSIIVSTLALGAFALGCAGPDHGRRGPRDAADVHAGAPATTQVTSAETSAEAAAPGELAAPPQAPALPRSDAVPIPGALDVPATGAERPLDTAAEEEEDRALSTKIRQALVRDESLAASANRIQIVSRDGAVTVRGTLASEADKERVLAEIENVPGVVSVDEQLVVGAPKARRPTEKKMAKKSSKKTKKGKSKSSVSDKALKKLAKSGPIAAAIAAVGAVVSSVVFSEALRSRARRLAESAMERAEDALKRSQARRGRAHEGRPTKSRRDMPNGVAESPASQAV